MFFCSFDYHSGIQMENPRWRLDRSKPFKNWFGNRMFERFGPSIQLPDHSNTGHKNGQFSNVSSIRVSGIRIPTLLAFTQSVTLFHILVG
jgi:hypothetical protein